LEALAMYVKALAEGEPYRAVLVDLAACEGMSAEQVIAELRRIDPGVKSVASTGRRTDPIMTDYERLGFNAAVMKPYEITQLSQGVHRVVEAGN
jgi:DNA-binding NtrC family response regulator